MEAFKDEDIDMSSTSSDTRDYDDIYIDVESFDEERPCTSQDLDTGGITMSQDSNTGDITMQNWCLAKHFNMSVVKTNTLNAKGGRYWPSTVSVANTPFESEQMFSNVPPMESTSGYQSRASSNSSGKTKNTNTKRTLQVKRKFRKVHERNKRAAYESLFNLLQHKDRVRDLRCLVLQSETAFDVVSYTEKLKVIPEIVIDVEELCSDEEIDENLPLDLSINVNQQEILSYETPIYTDISNRIFKTNYLASTSSAIASTSSAIASTSSAIASTSSAIASTSSSDIAITSRAIVSTSRAIANTSNAIVSESLYGQDDVLNEKTVEANYTHNAQLLVDTSKTITGSAPNINRSNEDIKMACMESLEQTGNNSNLASSADTRSNEVEVISSCLAGDVRNSDQLMGITVPGHVSESTVDNHYHAIFNESSDPRLN